MPLPAAPLVPLPIASVVMPIDLMLSKLTLPIILPIGLVPAGLVPIEPAGLVPIEPLQHLLVPIVLPISKLSLPFDLLMAIGVMVHARYAMGMPFRSEVPFLF